MLVILSPAKTLNFEKPAQEVELSQIRFPDEAAELADILRRKSPKELADLMKVNPQLAELNVERYLMWQWPFPADVARPALYAFKGEVYSGLDADTMDMEAIAYAQRSVRILSGLYGLLRPLDAILPYRLEMGTKLINSRGNNLYKFWNDKLTVQLNEDLESVNHRYLVNLASQEYFKSLQPENIKKEIITPEFREFKNESYKVVTIYAKKARGLMTRFIVENQLTNPEDLKAFDLEGYVFNNELSKPNKPVFSRH